MTATRISFPEQPEAMNAHWLTEVLRSSNVISRTEVQSVRFTSMQQERGGNGQIVRFAINYRQPEDGAPRSLIGKFPAADPHIRAFLQELGVYEREAHCYAVIAATEDLPAPRCYYSAFDPDTGASLLLLEDLGHLRAIETVTGAGATEVDAVIRGLAAFHASWWDKSQLEEMVWLPSFLHNVNFFRNLYEEGWEGFLRQMKTILPDYRLSTSFLDVGRSLDKYIPALCDQLVRPPVTCIHSDMHLENLLFGFAAADPPLTILDWQIIARGKGVIDVAYFLIRSVSPDQRRQSEQGLLETYHMLLTQMGVKGYDFANCWLDYRRAFIWPLLLVVVSVSVGDRSFIQNPARLRVSLQRLEGFVEDHNVEELLPT